MSTPKICLENELTALNNAGEDVFVHNFRQAGHNKCATWKTNCEAGDNCAAWGVPGIHDSLLTNEKVCWRGDKVARCRQTPLPDRGLKRLCPCGNSGVGETPCVGAWGDWSECKVKTNYNDRWAREIDWQERIYTVSTDAVRGGDSANQNCVTFYEGNNFDGTWAYSYPAGAAANCADCPNVGDGPTTVSGNSRSGKGIPNDQLSSMHVMPGCTVGIYGRNDYNMYVDCAHSETCAILGPGEYNADALHSAGASSTSVSSFRVDDHLSCPYGFTTSYNHGHRDSRQIRACDTTQQQDVTTWTIGFIVPAESCDQVCQRLGKSCLEHELTALNGANQNVYRDKFRLVGYGYECGSWDTTCGNNCAAWGVPGIHNKDFNRVSSPGRTQQRCWRGKDVSPCSKTPKPDLRRLCPCGTPSRRRDLLSVTTTTTTTANKTTTTANTTTASTTTASTTTTTTTTTTVALEADPFCPLCATADVIKKYSFIEDFSFKFRNTSKLQTIFSALTVNSTDLLDIDSASSFLSPQHVWLASLGFSAPMGAVIPKRNLGNSDASIRGDFGRWGVPYGPDASERIRSMVSWLSARDRLVEVGTDTTTPAPRRTSTNASTENPPSSFRIGQFAPDDDDDNINVIDLQYFADSQFYFSVPKYQEEMAEFESRAARIAQKRQEAAFPAAVQDGIETDQKNIKIRTREGVLMAERVLNEGRCFSRRGAGGGESRGLSGGTWRWRRE